MNERKSKNIVIIALCITLIFMGVGFSILSQELTINGSASVDANSTWDVRIESITPVQAVNAGTAVASGDLATYYAVAPVSNAIPSGAYGTITAPTSPNYSTAAFAVNLVQPGDYVIYKINTGNRGTLDAVLASATISTTDTNNNNADTSPNYTSAQDPNESEIYSYEFGTLSGTTFTAVAPVVANYTLDGGDYVGSATVNNATGNDFYLRVKYNDTEVNPGVLSSAQKTSSATVTFIYNQTQNS